LSDLEKYYDDVDGLMDAAEGLTDQLVIDLSSHGRGYIALADRADRADRVLRTLDADYNLNWETDINGESVSEWPPLSHP
jgi:hypothetical protein